MGLFDEIPAGAPHAVVPTAEFWIQDGIIFGRQNPSNPQVTLEDAIVAVQRVAAMSGAQRMPLIFDGRGLGWLGIDARAYVRAHAPDLFTRMAIVVRHELIRRLSHAFLGVVGPDIPTELFTDQEKAWAFVAGAANQV